MLDILYTAEMKSEHPLASAILSWLKGTEAAEIDADSFESVTGRGIQMQVHGVTYWVGSKGFLETFKAMVPPEAGREIIRWEEDGKSIVYYGWEAELLAVMAISDRLKPTSGEAVEALKEMGIEVHLLTGDGKRTAETVAAMLDIRHYKADVLPSDKEEYIRSLQAAGRKVAMVGDGINDSQALARADVSIAMGKGTDIAMDVAMVTLITSDLMLLPDAIRLSKRTVRSIHQNLFWAFIYNVIGIPLAAGIWYPLFGWKLNPMFGAAAMSLSSFCVVSNALRLNLFKMYDASKDKKLKAKKEKKRSKKEDKTMKKIMHIEGMMCGHCEARVKKALEALPQVAEAQVSHEKGTAVVKLNAEVSNEELTKAVEEQDYKVTSVE